MVSRMKNKRICRLGLFEEAVGTLNELVEDEGVFIARISEVILALPHEIEDRLRPLLGQRIGILHTDIPGKEYLVRDFPEEVGKSEKIAHFGSVGAMEASA